MTANVTDVSQILAMRADEPITSQLDWRFESLATLASKFNDRA
jgi:hypothetical protein